MMEKSLDRKLAAIHADPYCREFILADAKDADMAFGIGAPGQSPESHPGEVRFKTLAQYRDQIRAIARQGVVDIMLMSASTNYKLTIEERLFDDSHVTPAIRANDTTDIHIVRGSRYPTQPSLPFRTATLDHIQCGHLDCGPDERQLGVNLGLYYLQNLGDSDTTKCPAGVSSPCRPSRRANARGRRGHGSSRRRGRARARARALRGRSSRSRRRRRRAPA